MKKENNERVEVAEIADSFREKGLGIITVEINGSDFKKSLTYKDLNLPNDVERELAMLGRKAVLSKAYPLELRKNKEQVYTYLDKRGVRFGSFGTWVVPLHEYKEVVEELRSKQEAREDIKRRLMANYNDEVENFAIAADGLRPGFGDIVRRNAFTIEHVEGQISMHITAQDEMLAGVGGGAIIGLGRMARDYEQSLLKKAKQTNSRPRLTRKTTEKLRDLREYCQRFNFLTDALVEAEQLLDEAIASMPSEVKSGEPYLDETAALMRVLKLIQKADELQGMVNVPSMEIDPDAFNSFESISSGTTESDIDSPMVPEPESEGSDVEEDLSFGMFSTSASELVSNDSETQEIPDDEDEVMTGLFFS